ncbi:MAG TPA: helix-turn-helix domain-containing protein [Candidatus Thermoplasmatota archaeon]|nr:helix-turn-helix domain-containing protein [Candidatus Thermoplasmatota archaeon]
MAQADGRVIASAQSTRLRVAEKIAGEITLSPEPGATIRKWRETFGLSQTDLAAQLGVGPSVVSDYESGRRRSPGTHTVRKLVAALLSHDERRGGRVVRSFRVATEGAADDAILDIRELYVPVPTARLLEATDAEVVRAGESLVRELKGYTVIDSMKAITGLTSAEYPRIYGWSSERALIFTGVTAGRSPMVAIRVHPMKPALVVFHDPAPRIDELALKLADSENIPLAVTRMPLDKLIQNLKEL